jgi:hypothetical protein
MKLLMKEKTLTSELATTNPPAIPMAPATEAEVLERVEYLVDRIHKCEYDKLIYLLEIHQNNYWKMEFSSFEVFCKERLGYSKQYVYRCINAAKMVEAGVPVENPNQSLALEGLNVEEAKAIWDKAEESGKKITGGLLKKAREEQNVLDRAISGGINIDHLCEPFKELVGMLRSAKDLLHILSQTPDGTWLAYQSLAIKIRDVAEAVKFAMPNSVCPKCMSAGCSHCKELGWIPKAREIASDQ